MYPVSDSFMETVRRSHRLATKAEVIDSEGAILYSNLKINSGFVHDDKQAENRRRCNVFLTDTKNLTPSDANDLMHPLSNNYVKLYRGLIIPSTGQEELVPLGIFQLEDANIDDTGEELNVEIKGFDQSKAIQRARWTEPYQIASGTNVATAIADILTDRAPGIVLNFMETDAVTPNMVLGTGGWSGGGDPWENAKQLAESIGAELFFDVEGVCVLRPEPDPATDPVVDTYEEGPESLLLYVTRNITRENVFNHVIAIGNNSSLFAPLRAEAVDDDPNSPTYVNGPFGDVPTFYSSTSIASQQQCQDAADAKLRSVVGVPEQARFVSVVNPAHQVGDVVEVTRTRAQMYQSRYVLDKVVIPMEYSQPLNATCREKRIATS